MSILVLACGIWCLYFAVRGVNSTSWNPGGQKEAGKAMRGSTRMIYCVGGVLLTALGVVLWFHVLGK